MKLPISYHGESDTRSLWKHQLYTTSQRVVWWSEATDGASPLSWPACNVWGCSKFYKHRTMRKMSWLRNILNA